MSSTPLFDCIVQYARANLPVSLKTMMARSGHTREEVLAILHANRDWLELSGPGNFDAFRKVQFTEMGPPRQVTVLDVARIRAWYAGKLFRSRPVGQKEAHALEFFVGDQARFAVFEALKTEEVIASLGDTPIEFVRDTLENRQALLAQGFVDQDGVKHWSGWPEFPWQEPVAPAARRAWPGALLHWWDAVSAAIVRFVETPVSSTTRFMRQYF